MENSTLPLTSLLSDELSPGSLVQDEREIQYLSTDVYRKRKTPVAVVRPSSKQELLNTLKVAFRADAAIVIRGGGASYTDGYLPTREHAVLIDTSLLKKIDVNHANGYVTVEAGVTWAELKQVLEPQGLRTPFWGPFSGLAATVSGSVSQNAISHGSGSYGISAASVLSLEIATSRGEVFQTGAAAAGTRPFMRNFGPDTTGLFCGDCGTLGVKLSVTLPLLQARTDFETLSFSFPNFAALHAGMSAAAAAGLDDEHFALDAALSQGQIAKEEQAGRKKEIALSVLKNARSMTSGLAQLARMGMAGDRALKQSQYACHYIVEGIDKREAQAKADGLREILNEVAQEIPNTVPTVVRGLPFAPLTNVLGPKGERWAPLHGILAQEHVLPFHVALDAYFDERRSKMDELGVWTGGMFEMVGPSAFLYEIAIYWPGLRTAYHDTVLEQDYLASLPAYSENSDTDRFVENMRMDLVQLYRDHEAAHFQIGKVYPYWSRLDGVSKAMVIAIKKTTDPTGLLNPEALEIPTDQP